MAAVPIAKTDASTPITDETTTALKRLMDIAMVLNVLDTPYSTHDPIGPVTLIIAVPREYWEDVESITELCPIMIGLEFEMDIRSQPHRLETHCIIPDGNMVVVSHPDDRKLYAIACKHPEFLQLFADTTVDGERERIEELRQTATAASKDREYTKMMRFFLFKLDWCIAMYKHNGLLQMQPNKHRDLLVEDSVIAEIASVYFQIMRQCEIPCFESSEKRLLNWIVHGDRKSFVP